MGERFSQFSNSEVTEFSQLLDRVSPHVQSAASDFSKFARHPQTRHKALQVALSIPEVAEGVEGRSEPSVSQMASGMSPPYTHCDPAPGLNRVMKINSAPSVPDLDDGIALRWIKARAWAAVASWGEALDLYAQTIELALAGGQSALAATAAGEALGGNFGKSSASGVQRLLVLLAQVLEVEERFDEASALGRQHARLGVGMIHPRYVDPPAVVAGSARRFVEAGCWATSGHLLAIVLSGEHADQSTALLKDLVSQACVDLREKGISTAQFKYFCDEIQRTKGFEEMGVFDKYSIRRAVKALGQIGHGQLALREGTSRRVTFSRDEASRRHTEASISQTDADALGGRVRGAVERCMSYPLTYRLAGVGLDG